MRMFFGITGALIGELLLGLGLLQLIGILRLPVLLQLLGITLLPFRLTLAAVGRALW
jgi:hypothetical protein